jgi:small subunit ribosomal protein S16
MEKNAEKQVILKKERIEYWLSVGAKPTESVASVLKKFGIAFKK